MTRFEKGILAALVVCLIVVFLGIRSCSVALEQAGGVSGVLIEGGKEWQRIKREVAKEAPDG